MNLVEMLQAAGVDGHKADFYLASLELGEATVATIAQKAGIGRTNAYEVLDRLLATGLVATVQKGARSYVIPQDPIALLRRVECQRQVVQDVLPQLRALHNSSGGKPQVRFFVGVEGIKTVLDEMVESGTQELRAIMSNSELFRMPGYETIASVVAKRVKSGIPLRIIRCGPPDNRDLWRSSQRERRTLRFAPESFDAGVTTYLYDDTVAFISSKAEHYALSIQSAELCAFQTNFFEILWASSSPDEERSELSLRSLP
ncbi:MULTISPECIES: TrmB family transcriptional regulator [unclassified Caballeronia]|uniref:TrmB family transcriptional regulator n=1 Tax=unclassified Caballeronia TaxID=2646786 RepID=UPI0005515A6F|nr:MULTISPECIES: helix-turn-helix domain-containing protein [unclassified Caballeronia]MCE4546437.1 TrmB family transcriptional regulator [Caballeronia sp. PC1]MCE4573089.1 TrmB family transcriptional regulator [Caballeronia sp. CLC5]